MTKNREHKLNSKPILTAGKEVVYVMSRDQRVSFNHALFEAQNTAIELKLPLKVIFNFYPNVKNRALQHYEFMLEGLKEVITELTKKNIQFELNFASSTEQITQFLKSQNPAKVYFDMSPLRGARFMQISIAENLECACSVIDTHNIIPVWETSNKEEYAARTIRPKILNKLENYIEPQPKLINHPFGKTNNKFNLNEIKSQLKVSKLENYTLEFKPGYKNAKQMLNKFFRNSDNYADQRNDPSLKAISNLSPYLHFGQISSQEIALLARKKIKQKQSKESFLEELIIRKELSDNFCYYNPNYDSFEGLKDWAKQTLTQHEKDNREYIYTKSEFEEAKTHDPAWNAAQIQMTTTGKMHGYMRMYWAKKILEWTNNATEAIDIAIYLNDKYELDGYDPNGYVGILWSIGGIHDRGWTERPIFGKIRYMNFNGLKRKFDIDAYISTYIK